MAAPDLNTVHAYSLSGNDVAAVSSEERVALDGWRGGGVLACRPRLPQPMCDACGDALLFLVRYFRQPARNGYRGEVVQVRTDHLQTQRQPFGRATYRRCRSR